MSVPLRILHLEDNLPDGELVAAALKTSGLGAEVDLVAAREEFLAALSARTYDLVLADYSLPGFSGEDALALVRTRCPETPFIFVSGSLGEETAIEALKRGATDYVLKDRLSRLMPSVNRALSESRERQERRRVEESLRESETRFQQVTEHVGEWIWETNAEGMYTYSNSVVEQILGYTVSEVVGKLHFFDFFPPESQAEQKRAALANFTQKRLFKKFQNFCLHRNGQRVLLETSGTPVLDANGLLLGYRGIDTDITERQKIEERVHEQAALLDQTLDAISVRDLHGRIRYWNRGAQRLYGWTAEEAFGWLASERLSHSHYSPMAAAQQQTLESGYWQGELEQQTKSGQLVVVESRWTLVRDPAGVAKSILVVDTNVTEKKKFEAEYLRMQRLESIGRLAGGIAHDLNNVLAPIIMSVQLLREEFKDSNAQSLLDTLETSAQRGANIVKQVLTFARGIEGQRVPLQLGHLLKDVAKIVQETFPKNVLLHLELTPDLWLVNGDAAPLHQMLISLCANARDAMPAGGELTLAAQNLWLDEEFVRQTPSIKAGPHVCVVVADTGSGISAEVVEKIFDPYFTTKASDQGGGLGLSAVLGIVKSHQGYVQVVNKPGRGAEFRIYLPASVASSNPTVESSPTVVPDGQGEKILVVDDEESIREITKKILEKHGYSVLLACEGTEAVALYAQHRQDVKLVMTDMLMPFMDGFSTIRALQKMNPQIRLIAASGVGSTPRLTDPSELGVRAFLRKPFTAEVLLRTLREALRDHPE
jgi:PAS domain S-box-containing protein